MNAEPAAGPPPPAGPAPSGWSVAGRPPLAARISGHPHLLPLGGRLHLLQAAADLPAAWSADGLAWTPAETDLPFRALSAAAAHAGRLYVAGGCASPGAAVWEIWSSADGQAWRQVAAQQIVPRTEPMLASHRGELLMLAGHECLEGRRRLTNGILLSEDHGASWSGDRPPAFSPRSGAAAVTFQGRLWVLGGAGAQGPVADAWVRDDVDRTWRQSQPRVPWRPRHRHLAQVVGDSLYVGLGLGPGEVPLTDLWATDDGVHWRSVEAAGPAFTGGFAAASFGGELVVVGRDGPPGSPQGLVCRYRPPA